MDISLEHIKKNDHTTFLMEEGSWKLDGNKLTVDTGAVHISSDIPFNEVKVTFFKDLNKNGKLDEGDEVIGVPYRYSGTPTQNIDFANVSLVDNNSDPTDHGYNNHYGT